jgi:hypothetical protein
MYFAEFYTKGVQSGKLIAACGDRAVLKLDGRERETAHVGHAYKWAKQHGFEGFVLRRGASFSDSVTVTDMYVKQGGIYTTAI